MADLKKEHSENIEVYKSLIGTPIRYNRDIQIVHEASKKFLCVSSKQKQLNGEGSCIIDYTMEETSANSKSTIFQLMPAGSFQLVIISVSFLGRRKVCPYKSFILFESR